MPLAPGPLRAQFRDRLCSRAVGFAGVCPEHSGEERGGAVNRPPPSGELAPVVGEDAGKTQQTLTICLGLAEFSVERASTPTSGTASTMSQERRRTFSPSGPCSVPCLHILRRPTGAVDARWSVPVVAATPTLAGGQRR